MVPLMMVRIPLVLSLQSVSCTCTHACVSPLVIRPTPVHFVPVIRFAARSNSSSHSLQYCVRLRLNHVERVRRCRLLAEGR